MDNELKAFQKKALIAFSLILTLVFSILFMLDAAQQQRRDNSNNLKEAHSTIEKEIQDSNSQLMRIESKVDIILQNESIK